MLNGDVLDVAKINEFQKCMDHLASRGAMVTQMTGARVNDQIQVPLGLVSHGSTTPVQVGNTFRMGKKDLAIPLWLNPGYDTLTLMFQIRLQSMFPVPAVVGGYVGGVFRVEVVRGGTAHQVAYYDWRMLQNEPQQTAFFVRTIPLNSLFLNSPIHVEEIFLRLHYSSVEGYDVLLGQLPSGIFSNPEFWQGCSYFGCAVYKDCIPC